MEPRMLCQGQINEPTPCSVHAEGSRLHSELGKPHLERARGSLNIFSLSGICKQTCPLDLVTLFSHGLSVQAVKCVCAYSARLQENLMANLQGFRSEQKYMDFFRGSGVCSPKANIILLQCSKQRRCTCGFHSIFGV